MAHTILLIQFGTKETRTWCDFESVKEAIESVVKMFEQHLKEKHKKLTEINYDVQNLFEFIDRLTDLSCVVFQKNTQTYAPYSKDWVKEKVYLFLRQQSIGMK